MTWIEQTFYRWLEAAVFVVLATWAFLFVPLFFVKKLRPWVGFGLVYGSYVTGFTCWLFCLIITSRTLGGIWLTIGLLCSGVGVFPLAVIGVLVQGLWSAISDLIFAIASTFISRLLGFWLVRKHENAAFEAKIVAKEAEYAPFPSAKDVLDLRSTVAAESCTVKSAARPVKVTLGSVATGTYGSSVKSRDIMHSRVRALVRASTRLTGVTSKLPRARANERTRSLEPPR
jgi:hypothetical protein